MDKIKVCYIYRSKDQGNISIEKVFGCIEEELKDKIEISRIEVPEYRITPQKLVKNVLYCREKAKEINADIYHITGDIHYIALALPPKKTILTVHDIVLLQYASKFKRSFFKVFWFNIPIKRCRMITAISTKTADDLYCLFPKEKGKIRVIENPLIGNFNFCPKEKSNNPPRILQVGTRENKNLNRVAEALNGVDCELRIIGKLTEEQRNLLKKNNINYSNVFDISEEQLVQEYEECDVVLFVSTFEGFGLPIIEAQAVGRPVITSNLMPMNDVAGVGAHFVYPYSVREIRSAVENVLDNEQYVHYLVQAGKGNIKRFTPDVIGKKYLRLYQRMING